MVLFISDIIIRLQCPNLKLFYKRQNNVYIYFEFKRYLLDFYV